MTKLQGTEEKHLWEVVASNSVAYLRLRGREERLGSLNVHKNEAASPSS